MTATEPRKPGMSLSGKILLGMGLGIPVGLFFGEEVAFLNFIGEAFVQLLQVSILPFVLVSLIVGLGKLTYDQALALAKKGGLILGFLWLLGIVVVAVMPFSFPDWESASFFVPSLIEEPKEVDFLELYIPANPFFSLANSIVPAIVVFGLIMGVALIGIEGKQGLLLVDMEQRSVVEVRFPSSAELLAKREGNGDSAWCLAIKRGARPPNQERE